MDITCPMCGCTDFDTEDHTLQGFYPLMYRKKHRFFRGWRGKTIRARACLNCGFVAVFLMKVGDCE